MRSLTRILAWRSPRLLFPESSKERPHLHTESSLPRTSIFSSAEVRHSTSIIPTINERDLFYLTNECDYYLSGITPARSFRRQRKAPAQQSEPSALCTFYSLFLKLLLSPCRTTAKGTYIIRSKLTQPRPTSPEQTPTASPPTYPPLPSPHTQLSQIPYEITGTYELSHPVTS